MQADLDSEDATEFDLCLHGSLFSSRLGRRFHCLKLQIDHYFISDIQSAVRHRVTPGDSVFASVDFCLSGDTEAGAALCVLDRACHRERQGDLLSHSFEREVAVENILVLREALNAGALKGHLRICSRVEE